MENDEWGNSRMRQSEKLPCPSCSDRGVCNVYVKRELYFMASSMATATETVAPTMGLLPMPMRPIIST